MFKKFLKFNFKYKFQLPKHNKIIIFDKEGAQDIKNYILNSMKEHSVYDANTIIVYLNIKFIITLIKNLLTKHAKNTPLLKRLYLNYIKTEIQFINPRIVITYNDDNIIYHNLIKLFPKISFMAIQNGLREKFIRERVQHEINHDYLYCFGYNDKKNNILTNWKVKNTCPIGSLRAGIALSKFKSSNKKYDLCLISEYESRKKNDPDKHHWNDHWLEVSEIISQLIKKNNYKIIIALNGHGGTNEINFFQSLFPANIEYSNPKKEYDSYRAILESNLTLGFCSTLLVESMALKTKVLQVNTADSNEYFNFNDIFIHKYVNLHILEDNIRELIPMTYEEYFNKIRKFLPEYMNIDSSNLPHNLIQTNIKEILSST